MDCLLSWTNLICFYLLDIFLEMSTALMSNVMTDFMLNENKHGVHCISRYTGKNNTTIHLWNFKKHLCCNNSMAYAACCTNKHFNQNNNDKGQLYSKPKPANYRRHGLGQKNVNKQFPTRRTIGFGCFYSIFISLLYP